MALGWLKRYGSAVSSTYSKVVEHASRGIDVGVESGKSIRRPRPFSKAAFYGTDEDGGIARFRQQTLGMSQEQIEQAAEAWERDRTFYLLSCLVVICLIPVTIVYGFYSFYTIIALLFLASYLMVKATQADFRHWQIRQGRFGPLAEYLDGRLPINMQIIKKD
jgi:hypothetical protein